MLADLRHFLYHIEGIKPDAKFDMEAIKELVPEPITIENYFRQVGQWGDGEKFAASQ